jgi:hypothetical protein
MLSKEGPPKKIEYPNDYPRGIPMKINYNKPSFPLQDSGHLIEEVDRTV